MPFQHKVQLPILFSLFIFLSAALPLRAGVLVIAYMDESKVVLVDDKTPAITEHIIFRLSLPVFAP